MRPLVLPRLGVQLGWEVQTVARTTMPADSTSKSVLEALATGKKGGEPYDIVFLVAAGAVATTREVVLEVKPIPLGVTVVGREVTKVAPKSQAEQAGVEIGWIVFSVDGKSMPDGAAGTKAVSDALAAGKKSGKKYPVIFLAPALPIEEPPTKVTAIEYDTSIAKAVRAAKPGATVSLQPGTYHLKNPLKIATPICLDGGGLEEGEPSVVIVYAGDGAAIEYAAAGAGEGSLTALCIRCSKEKGAGDDSAVAMLAGSLVLAGCVIEHAGGSGVSVQGKGTRMVLDGGQVRNCRKSGVTVARGAHATLVGGAVLSGNLEYGLIAASRETAVMVQGAQVMQNGDHGLYVWKGGEMTVTGETTVRENEGSGVSASDVNTILTVEGETVLISSNKKHGVMVQLGATGVVQGGVCVWDNEQDGVIFTTEGTHGIAKNVYAQRNAWVGIRATFEAEAEVHQCTLQENGKHDLAHEIGAKLQATGNQLDTFTSYLEGFNKIMPKAKVQTGSEY